MGLGVLGLLFVELRLARDGEVCEQGWHGQLFLPYARTAENSSIIKLTPCHIG